MIIWQNLARIFKKITYLFQDFCKITSILQELKDNPLLQGSCRKITSLDRQGRLRKISCVSFETGQFFFKSQHFSSSAILEKSFNQKLESSFWYKTATKIYTWLFSSIIMQIICDVCQTGAEQTFSSKSSDQFFSLRTKKLFNVILIENLKNLVKKALAYVAYSASTRNRRLSTNLFTFSAYYKK